MSVPLMGDLKPVDVAPLGNAGLTAYRPRAQGSAPRGAGHPHGRARRGGLGHIGILALRALSQTEIIVVDRNPEALEPARGWGADHVVVSKEDRSHVQEIRDLSDGAGAEVVRA